MIILPRLLDAQWITLIVNHLWQSTIFALAAWLLTLALKKNRARIRYWLWLLASMKFLLPFSLLIKAGERLHSHSSLAKVPGLSAAMNGFTEPFSGSVAAHPATSTAVSAAAQSVAQTHSGVLPMVLLAIWACGALFLLARWGVRWLRIRCMLWTSSPIAMACAVPVRSAPGHLEPGIFGIFRPVLLLPEGIAKRLSPAQLDAIVAHEICHVRRRDNLTAALHMLVEVVFWFYPLVWWIGAGLMEERERACDEAVVESCGETLTYAEGILNVCKTYMEAPINCVSGVMGSDLKKRISRILSGSVAGKLNLRRKLLLALAALLAVAVPVITGIIHTAQAAADAEGPAYRNVSIQLASAGPAGPGAGEQTVSFQLNIETGRLEILGQTLRPIIAKAYGVTEAQVVGRDWANEPHYNITVDGLKASESTSGSAFASPIEMYGAALRELLAEEFGLVISLEQGQLDGYALLIGNGEPKLTASAAGGMISDIEIVSPDGRDLKATNVPLSNFAEGLSNLYLGGLVVDQTGLQGNFDFEVKLPISPLFAPDTPLDPAALSKLSKALEQQLGLKIEAKKLNMDVVNIVNLKPSAEVVTAPPS